MPWFVKAMAKVVISRLPISYGFWSNAQLFRHGRNDDPAYSFQVFDDHVSIANPRPGFVCLEIGPGDAIASAVLTPAFGGHSSYQVDVGAFATTRLDIYRPIARYASEHGRAAPSLETVKDFESMMAACNAHYLTEGLRSLQSIPDESVDFIFSHACLQLVRAAEFDSFLHEFRRVIRADGCMTHRIPFNCHLDQDANSLRFPDAVWETDFVVKSGFYTNRLAPSEVIAAFERAGFSCEIIAHDRREKTPNRRKFAARFRNMNELDLNTKALTLRLRPI